MQNTSRVAANSNASRSTAKGSGRCTAALRTHTALCQHQVKKTTKVSSPASSSTHLSVRSLNKGLMLLERCGEVTPQQKQQHLTDLAPKYQYPTFVCCEAVLGRTTAVHPREDWKVCCCTTCTALYRLVKTPQNLNHCEALAEHTLLPHTFPDVCS
jgi:hypothetical protein